MLSKGKNQPDLHILTDKVSMKFTPSFYGDDTASKSAIIAPTEAKNSGIFSWFSAKSTTSQTNSLANSMIETTPN